MTQPQYQPPQGMRVGSAEIVPQTWLEWLWSVWHPDDYIAQWQMYGLTIAVAANRAGNADKIQVPVPFFCFGCATRAWDIAAANNPVWPIRIGFKNATANDWTNGQWAASLVTGERGLNGSPSAGDTYREWILPRELAANEVVTVTIDNNVNAAAAALTVDIAIWGYEVRERGNKIKRRPDGSAQIGPNGMPV